MSHSVVLKDGVEIITPDESVLAEELNSYDNLVCPITGCGKKTNNSSSLRLHVIKAHGDGGTRTLDRGAKKAYACPVRGCPRHVEGMRQHFFSIMFLVKRHYLNVHAEKRHACSKCGKSFGRMYAMENHQKSCRKLFYCTCGTYYTTKNALQMHVQRKGKGHAIKADPDEENKTSRKSEVAVLQTQLVSIPCMLYIPKAPTPIPPPPPPPLEQTPINNTSPGFKRNIEIQPKKPKVLSRFEKTMQFLSSQEAQEVLSNSALLQCLMRQKQEQKHLCEKACAKVGKECKHRVLKLQSHIERNVYGGVQPNKKKEEQTSREGRKRRRKKAIKHEMDDQIYATYNDIGTSSTSSSNICSQGNLSNTLQQNFIQVNSDLQKGGIDYTTIEVLETSDFSAQCHMASLYPSENIAGMDTETQTEDFDAWFNNITSNDMETQTHVSIQTPIERIVKDTPSDSLDKSVQLDDILNGHAWENEQDIFSGSFTNTATQTTSNTPALFLSNNGSSNVKQTSATQTASELVDFEFEHGFAGNGNDRINDRDIALNENSMETISMSFGTQTVFEELDSSSTQEMLSLGTQTVFHSNFLSSSGTQTVSFLDHGLSENSMNAKTIETQTSISFADLFDTGFLDEYLNADRILATSETQTFDDQVQEVTKTLVTIETQTGS